MRTRIVNGYLIDPATGREGPMDLVMEKGVIDGVGETHGRGVPEKVIDASGCFVVPGFVDLQVNPGKGVGHIAGLLPLRGITTGVFMPCTLTSGEPVMEACGGPEGFVAACGGQACNIMPSLPVVPEDAVGHDAYEKLRIPADGVKEALSKAIKQGFGAIGEAILPLGGPAHVRSKICEEFLDLLLDATNETGIPLQVHTGLGIEGIRKALEVSRGRRMHLCHVGSTCAGDDIHEAIKLFADYPAVTSDTHLSEVAGTTSRSSDLVRRYFDQGRVVKVDAASLDAVPVTDLENTEPPLYYGKDNLFTNNLTCAVSSGIDAIESDELGDGIRSNLMLKNALRLVNTVILEDQKMDLLKKLVGKMTVNPARILKISRGSLEEGAAADVAVIDLDNEDILHVWVNGCQVVSEGCLTGELPGVALDFAEIRGVRS
ncbi:MAG: amidohydrolase family protein [Thermovirgaceae bacterium]